MLRGLVRNRKKLLNAAYEIGTPRNGRVLVSIPSYELEVFIEWFIEQLKIKVIPTPETYSVAKQKKILEACKILNLKPYQEKVITEIDFWFDQCEIFLSIDFKLLYSVRTLALFDMLISDTEKDAFYTAPFIDDNESMRENLENVTLVGFKYKEDSNDGGVLSFLRYAFDSKDINFMNGYILEEDGEEQQIIELEFPEDIYFKCR